MTVPDRLPQFLVVSPPKTGSTWLADNLRCHPQIFVPAIKEVKFFSSLHRWLDLNWYCSHFDQVEGQISGEASPSYAALPLERIQAIRGLMPDVKIIFLMRDPVSRAWSHAKHMHCYREGCFTDCDKPIDQVADAEWRAAFEQDWLLASGDYLGQLRRWMSVFPRSQIHVGFFESIGERSVELLRGTFSFLGVDPNIELSRFPIHDKILAGPEHAIPYQLEVHLRSLLSDRTEQLVAWLQEKFSISPPAAWRSTRAEGPSRPFPDFGEAELARIAAKETTFRTAYRQLALDYRGFDLQFFRGRLLAMPKSMAAPQDIDGPHLERAIQSQIVLTAHTLAALKETVTSHVLEKQAEKLSELERELMRARDVAVKLRTDLQTLVHEVRDPAPPAWKRLMHGLGRRVLLPFKRRRTSACPVP